MLKAYIDDTVSEREPSIFVLAGHVTQAENWARFSEAWQLALDMKPRIDYFKLKDALTQKGEFRDWSKALCDERIAIFRQIIERFDLCEFAIIFRIDEYLNGFASRVPRKLKNPFYFASHRLFVHVARHLENFRLPREPLDVIFDNREIEKDKFIAAWEWAKSRSVPDPLDLFSRILINPPYFQDDRDVLPLQAADMHATCVRLSFEKSPNHLKAKNVANLKLPGFTRELRSLLMTWNEDRFRQQAEHDNAFIRQNGLL